MKLKYVIFDVQNMLPLKKTGINSINGSRNGHTKIF